MRYLRFLVGSVMAISLVATSLYQMVTKNEPGWFLLTFIGLFVELCVFGIDKLEATSTIKVYGKDGNCLGNGAYNPINGEVHIDY